MEVENPVYFSVRRATFGSIYGNDTSSECVEYDFDWMMSDGHHHYHEKIHVSIGLHLIYLLCLFFSCIDLHVVFIGLSSLAISSAVSHPAWQAPMPAPTKTPWVKHLLQFKPRWDLKLVDMPGARDARRLWYPMNQTTTNGTYTHKCIDSKALVVGRSTKEMSNHMLNPWINNQKMRWGRYIDIWTCTIRMAYIYRCR